MSDHDAIVIGSGATKPALTAMANALRVGDHLLERMGAPVEAAAVSH